MTCIPPDLVLSDDPHDVAVPAAPLPPEEFPARARGPVALANHYLAHLHVVAGEDVAALHEKDAAYGGSWKKRGGVGAFMMLARKWDRLELELSRKGWDIFGAAEDDPRLESVMDDLNDLARYLLLVRAELRVRKLERSGG